MARFFKLVSLLVVLTFLSFPAHAQQSKRLILKDGSYQPVVQWEVKGNRVRYLSAERFEWEEVPYSMVDWEATKKYEEDLKKGATQKSEELSKDIEEEKTERDQLEPPVAPGVRLPSTGGVFLLDYFRNQPELVEMAQSGSEINKNVGGNILRATINPFAGNKQSIELKGVHSRVQTHVPRPEIYINAEEDTGATNDAGAAAATADSVRASRYRIVRLTTKKDTRVVGNLKVALTGKVSQQQTFVPSSLGSFEGGWLKLMPSQDLAPGEYAIVEMLSEKEINLYVWDFGVNPTAPENPNVWKPVAPTPKAGTTGKPELQDRKK